ncbi:hypothetical protein DAEQUDRAFT_811063 [Daedalea quercina L-15889]|uniref:Uncharacterized protein n=1 Tax=Daedalea quercina L-15889 TaxID=1314783 RepID=A0A165QQ19_9APHY|nr:hypothetical protein DAEQUDRAFT_811063 [Daedalea quercina L-15889]
MLARPRPESASIYIILEALDAALGRFHWSLAVFPSDTQPDWTRVDLFQIVDSEADDTSGQPLDTTSVNVESASHSLSLPNGVHVPRVWHLEHCRDVDLFAPERICVGAVRLPDADFPYKDLRGFIEEQEAEQGDSTTIRGVPWSCAQWVMRVLTRLIESGLYEELDMNHFYPKIQTLGTALTGLQSGNPNEMHILHFV